MSSVPDWRAEARFDCPSCGYVRRDGGYYLPGQVCLRCETPEQAAERRERMERAKVRRVIREMIAENRAHGLAALASSRPDLLRCVGVDPDTGEVSGSSQLGW